MPSQDFSFKIEADSLVRGLRPSEKYPRDSKYLYQASGVVGDDGVLSVLDQLTRIDTSIIAENFPFPQLFVFTKIVLVCGQTKIYELDNGVLMLKYTAPNAGGIWSAVDFYDYIYITNGSVAVVRDAGSKVFAATTDLPHATAVCNYNGQVLVGAPDVDGLGVSLTISSHDEADVVDMRV